MSLQEHRVERRLAAIFAADVAGYSRLMSQDEDTTIRILTAHREIMDRLIAEHGGRIANTAGDSVLAEFPSAVDAVRCAVEVQDALVSVNQDKPDQQCLRFRIGVHVGDVIVRGNDLLGDSVNIASRLEGLAEPGSVYISEAAHAYVRRSLTLTADDLGLQEVKNMDEPVRVFRVRAPASPFVGSAPGVGPTQALPIPNKPSIAVLPFTNMSGDSEQDYLADGVVEEITAALSRVRTFFVIARNSAFAYKGKAVDVRQVSRELGVRYVLEGSVRKSGNRLRIVAQLIDATTGAHIWAEQYGGRIEDVFDLQDQITASVVGAIQPSVRAAEIERARRKRPDSLDVYDLVMRALPDVWSLNKDANVRAVGLLEQALQLDPNYPTALALLAWCRGQRAVYNWSTTIEEDKHEALRLAEMASVLTADDPFVLTVLGAALTITQEFTAAAKMLDAATRLDPNSSWAWNRSGFLRNYLGDPETAIHHFERAIRLSPFDPMVFNSEFGIGSAHFIAGRYERAIEFFERGLISNPKAAWIHRHLAPAYVLAGQEEKAKASIRKLLESYPDLTVSAARRAMVFQGEVLDRICDGLRRAGLPH
ncbi:adenylate/guanylate cyclase domain-containing protein [Microvirga aerophila]|uniref:adenylate/guanylate cyclase domain-containing protein n=1 Tax=Microvirga aerophila TaxID=670291 RepID=UPI0011BEDCEF|nr:adenylate/guanylate cyclase domain-containing protein [Microvirga aerophila]